MDYSGEKNKSGHGTGIVLYLGKPWQVKQLCFQENPFKTGFNKNLNQNIEGATFAGFLCGFYPNTFINGFVGLGFEVFVGCEGTLGFFPALYFSLLGMGNSSVMFLLDFISMPCRAVVYLHLE